MFTNQSEVAAKVVLYDCIARHDGDDAVATCFTEGISDESAGSLGNALVGLTPYKSGMFTKNWKIRKVSSFVLSPGAHHIHYIKAKVNKTVSNAWIDKTPAAYLSPYTCSLMAVVHGMPINDVTTRTQISTAATAIDVVTTLCYDYSWDSHNTQSISASNNLPTAFTNAPAGIDLDGDVNTPAVA